MKPFLTFLALASLLLFGCEPEGQDIAFEVNVTQWANPDLPEVGATVVLEEQRLTNGVLNSFFTEIERATTPESGVVALFDFEKPVTWRRGSANGPEQRARIANPGRTNRLFR